MIIQVTNMEVVPTDVLKLFVSLLPTKYVYRFCLTNKKHAHFLEDDFVYQNKFKIFNKDVKGLIRYLYYQSDVLGLNKEIDTEMDKIPILMYRIRYLLHKNPNTKFIIVYNDCNALREIYRELGTHQISYCHIYNATIFHHSSSDTQMGRIQKFNQPNLDLQAVVTHIF